MPGIPQEIIAEIHDRNDIVSVIQQYVPLKRRGTDFWGLCPFHKEKTPSFKVSPSHQAFYCFGCRKSGNVFHFIMEMEGVDFVGAVRLLAQRVGLSVPEPGPSHGGAGPLEGQRGPSKEKIFELLRESARWFQRQLAGPEGTPARQYLERRGVPPEAVEAFGLGFAPDRWDALLQWAARRGYDRRLLLAAGLVKTAAPRTGEPNAAARVYDLFRGRLMFPIHDELGRIVGFSGRTLEADAPTAKYVNTPETSVFLKSRLLYALHRARTAFRDHGSALVCEGQLDVIACHRAGLTHAVAPQGTAFTETHAALLRRFTNAVTFAFDADSAGRHAAVRSVHLALAAELRPRVVELPEGEDPDSILRNRGPEALQEIMRQSLDAFEFLYRTAAREHDPGAPDGKAAIARSLLEAVIQAPDPVLRSAHCQWLARRLNLPESALLAELRRLTNRQQRRRRFTQPRPASAVNTTDADPRPGPAGAPGAKEQHAREMLLDIALRHGPSAHQLAEKILPEYLDRSPVSRALELVLRETAEDRWEKAGLRLSADPELGRDPVVGRILAAPAFPELTPETQAESARKNLDRRISAALEDCLAVLEICRIDRVLSQMQKTLAAARPEKRKSEKSEKNDDSETLHALLAEYQTLIRQRDQLTRRRGPG